ncbi:MAG: tautomerase family protein [Casimicrobiaceae bacterium]
MPLVTVTMKPGRDRAFKSAILANVHGALVASGVPETDRFQRVLECHDDNFRYDASYPDAASPRVDDFVLIEILWSVGRSAKIKRKVVADIVAALKQDPGLDPEHVMIVFNDIAWENWAFAGGRILHAS